MNDLWGFLSQTLTVSTVAALVLAVKAMFRDKLPPKWQFAVWAVPAIAMLIPAGLGGRYVLIPWPTVVDWFKTTACGDLSLTRVTHFLPELPGAMPQSLPQWLYLIYAAGFWAHLAYYALTYIRLRQLLRRGECVTLDSVVRISGELGIKPCKTLRLSGISTAFVCGVFHPVLAVPEDDPEDAVILHELLHLKHRDSVWNLLICGLRSLHWCNPFLVYCAGSASNDLECRCDQAVLERLEGEERREYGHILLSMCNERYASTPGCTGMSNGGRNIRRRIEAIARFRRYPVGMELVSACVGLILAVNVAAGTPMTVDAFSTGDWNLSAARTACCTTPAGAFDSYAKAVFNQSATGRILCAPEELLGELSNSYPVWDAGLTGTADPDSEYYIYNLTETDGGYRGMLVLVLQGDDSDHTVEIAYQSLLAYREQGRWVIRALEEFQTKAVPEASAIINWDCWELPSWTYSGQYDDLLVELRVQTVHKVDNQTTSAGLFGTTTSFDNTLKPDAEFQTVTVSNNTTVTHLGTQEQRDAMHHIGLGMTPVMPGDEPPEQVDFYRDGLDASRSSTDGSYRSNRTLDPGWGPVVQFYGGGSRYTPEEYSEPLAEYYYTELYINHEPVTAMRLTLTEGGPQ